MLLFTYAVVDSSVDAAVHVAAIPAIYDVVDASVHKFCHLCC